MVIYSVDSEEFRRFGSVIEGVETDALLEALERISPCPEEGTVYVPDVPEFDELPVYDFLSKHVYGGMPVQIGYCSGTNYKLNCLEYHKGWEVNVSTDELIILLSDLRDIRGGKLRTSSVMAFRVPARTVFVMYGTTLHYAPCGRFKNVVVLPKGTNYDKPVIEEKTFEDRLLWGSNKWLIAHPDTDEAREGAYIGLEGENIDISECF